MHSRTARRIHAALFASALLTGCQGDEPLETPPSSSPGAVPVIAPPAPPIPPAPRPKAVPGDITTFLAWAVQAGAGIERGPKPTADHPVLGDITCGGYREPIVGPGQCFSSKQRYPKPRYAGEWRQSEPATWALHIYLRANAKWVDCKALGKATIRTSSKPNGRRGKIVMHRCSFSDTEDVWLDHVVNDRDPGSTRVYLFSKDFPQADATPWRAPQAKLYRNLASGK